jgi:hypothetical protein
MAVFYALLGIGLLFAGRRLYWLFVGVAGFVVGIGLSGVIFSNSSEIVRVIIALVLGMFGVAFALVLQRLAVSVAGFVAGGYVLGSLFQSLGFDLAFWLTFLIGGVIGAILLAMLFDPALIVLSALLGANLLVSLASLDRWLTLVLFVVLSGIGTLVQVASWRKK